ncbi:uncharacterized protein EV420DRAFT_1486983 [Desarmillaria tabescens]|uniref:Uncharacterized protein n=1 Tax=Armillaria tabescens TaxID=1929756 RepID=A0AA39J7Q6_ARMTA|nr:uncharacterized protein EV420DRAFT_1486983 [Desarmillaria tabescens]KAK0437710.1 hypothetical protein EV420DRAFT_1486983 [Desarmillaria tabescens]
MDFDTVPGFLATSRRLKKPVLGGIMAPGPPGPTVKVNREGSVKVVKLLIAIHVELVRALTDQSRDSPEELEVEDFVPPMDHAASLAHKRFASHYVKREDRSWQD